jgi:RNA polymerase sigma factor (sigma-70 family)
VSALEAVQETIAPVGVPTTAERSLEGLYARHADRVFGFCRRRLRSHQEAEDATQTTFLQAFRALQRGVVPVSEQAWLFKIAENVCLSAHRTNGRRSERELADGTAAIDAAPARDSGADALVGLDEALASIPRRQRDVFVLRELRGLSYKEIAVSLELSVTSVEMLVFRARRNLARALENGAGLRGRVAGVFDLAAAVNAFKSALSGVGAAKLASTAAAVVVVVALPAGDAARPEPTAPPRAPTATTEIPAPAPVLRRASAKQSSIGPAQSAAGAERRLGARPEGSHRGSPRRPRPDRVSGAPPTPPAGGAPGSPQAPPTPAVDPPAPSPIQLPQPPPINLPQLPQLPQTPQLPQVPQLPELPELPQLPVELPTGQDPSGLIDLPTTP